MSSLLSDSGMTCARCSRPLPPGALACDRCHTLVHEEEMERRAAEARALEKQNRQAEARERWLAILPLLPFNSEQAEWIRDHARQLELAPAPQQSANPGSPDRASQAGVETPGAQPKSPWAKRLAPLAPLAVLLAKFKTVAILFTKFQFEKKEQHALDLGQEHRERSQRRQAPGPRTLGLGTLRLLRTRRCQLRLPRVIPDPLGLLRIEGQQWQNGQPALARFGQAALGFQGAGLGSAAFHLLRVHQGVAALTCQRAGQQRPRTMRAGRA